MSHTRTVAKISDYKNRNCTEAKRLMKKIKKECKNKEQKRKLIHEEEAGPWREKKVHKKVMLIIELITKSNTSEKIHYFCYNWKVTAPPCGDVLCVEGGTGATGPPAAALHTSPSTGSAAQGWLAGGCGSNRLCV